MDKSGQEDCDELTKLKMLPEERDAWTQLVKRVATTEQNWKFVQRILMHEPKYECEQEPNGLQP